ncbi:MAG TPA: hypothetical protein PKB08_13930 [Burkholderiaceae bacterium]|nr:hypothetical protein [Burkholderiaceae bacterium]
MNGRRPDATRRMLLQATAACAGGVVALPRRALSAGTERVASGRRFAFALIGDVPYSALEAQWLARLFDDFDRDIAFAIHVGDIKAGWERCDDALLAARRALLEACPVPLVYVPGDNEWTDCARPRAGGFDPLERLDWLRRHFFAQSRPLGAGVRRAADALPGFERQADHTPGGPPENLRWRHGAIGFVTLNLPGSNNGLASEGLGASELRVRERFNAEWLHEAYAIAAREAQAALVVVAHANPHFDRDRAGRSAPGASGARRDGYAAFRRLLNESSDAFAGPTLFLHGDTHWHTVQAISPKLTRIEAHGSPFVDQWVRIDVDADAREPFSIVSRRIAAAQPTPP